MTNLVLQSFGRENEYKRAILTVLSYYACTGLPVNQTKVILFTDNPNYFAPFLKGLPVEFVILSPEKIQQMRGAIDFLHRMKIALIDEAFSMIDGNMLYADSDTFFIADPTPFMNSLDEGACFMHLLEYEFESMRYLPLPAGKTFRAFLNLIETKTFKLNSGQTISVSPQDVSWNAGVMMFHSSHRKFIPDVYLLTDQFYPATQNHASEQYAFSVLFQKNTHVEPCSTAVYHYWYRVKKQIVDLFLTEKLSISWGDQPLEKKLTDVKKWCEILPAYFKDHILTIRDNAIQAFNERDPFKGYGYALKALWKKPFAYDFIKDVLYHTKTLMRNK